MNFSANFYLLKRCILVHSTDTFEGLCKVCVWMFLSCTTELTTACVMENKPLFTSSSSVVSQDPPFLCPAPRRKMKQCEYWRGGALGVTRNESPDAGRSGSS